MQPQIEDRLMGTLALNGDETVTKSLIVKLDGKEIQFVKNIDDPVAVAKLAFAVYTAATQLHGTRTEPQFLIRLEDADPGGYASIVTDGKYLMYVAISSTQ